MVTCRAVIIGSADWSARIERVLGQHGISTIRYTGQSGYVARLAVDHPALIVIDGDQPNTAFWITTPRVSSATRRIPVIVLSASSQISAAALATGASLVLPEESLAVRLPQIVAEYAHLPSESERGLLPGQCDQPTPLRVVEAIRQFNAGEYYQQHNLLEALWMEESGPVRALYQGILQVGIAYFQVTRANRKGALKMLLRARQWLDELPDACQGVDVAQLRADAAEVQAALERCQTII